MKRFVPFGALGAGVIIALASSASAGIIFEVESNDSLATAQHVGTFSPPGGAIAIDGSLGSSGSDVDWYAFDITGPSTVLLAALAPVGNSTTIDGQMMLVSASGDVIEFDDDDGPGLLPAFFVQNLTAGSYFIGVSGFDDIVFSDDPVGTDTLFDGLNNSGAPHGEVFQYKLSLAINVIPAPASAALLAAGGLVASRRRRSSN